MFTEIHKHVFARITLAAILIAVVFGIHPAQAQSVDFGQGQNMDAVGPADETVYRGGGGGGLPGPVTPIAPKGTVMTNTPTYTWTQVSNATWYQLWVAGPSGAVLKIWHTPQSANCNGTTCSVTPTKVTMGKGNYTWGVQTWNETGFGEWRKMSFTIP